MNLLILVLSCRRAPYDALYDAQRRTWDSLDVEGVRTRYYFCEGYDDMLWRLKRALDEALREPFDFLFRTNSSSYVDKQALLNVASGLPARHCYFGIDGDGFASGAGMLLSRDVCELLREKLPVASARVEDEVIGEVLARHEIGVTPGATRCDFWTEKRLREMYGGRPMIGALPYLSDEELRSAYHYRCKSDSNDRTLDIAAMEEIHKWKTTA